MTALIIIFAILVLLLLIPVGADASFIEGEFRLSAKVGPVKVQVFPAGAGKASGTGKKHAKKEPPKPKKEKKGPKLGKDDIISLAKIALKALSRFRRQLCIDVFMLHITSASPDPYDMVSGYGLVNSVIGAVYPLMHRAFKIRHEDIGTAMDFESDKTRVDARVSAVLQVWEILYTALCAGISFLIWNHRRKKRLKEQNNLTVLRKEAEDGQ